MPGLSYDTWLGGEVRGKSGGVSWNGRLLVARFLSIRRWARERCCCEDSDRRERIIPKGSSGS